MHDAMKLPNFIWFLTVGGLAGGIAYALTKGPASGLFGDITVGIVGAFCGGVAYQLNITVYGFGEVLGFSVLGAVILLGLRRAFSPPREAFEGPSS